MINVSDHALVRFLERTGLASFDGLRADLAQSLARAREKASDLDRDSFVVVADGFKYIVERGVLVTVLDPDTPPRSRPRRR